MTWETLASLITIALAGITIGKVIYELSKTLTKLNCSVEILNNALSALTCENSDEHKELYGAVGEIYENISEIRQKLYEKEEKK